MNFKKQYFAEFFRNDYYTIEVAFLDQREMRPPMQHTFQNPRDFEIACAAYIAQNPKTYTYKVPKDLKIDQFSTVIIRVDNGEDYTLKPARVIKVNEDPAIHEDNGFSYKWIVGRAEEVLKTWTDNKKKDDDLAIAVNKLEKAMTRVSLRQQLKLAMETLDPDTKSELAKAFGADLLLESAPSEKKE